MTIRDDPQNQRSAVTEPPGHHFGTEHLLANLKQRIISSGVVQVVAQTLQFVLMLAYNVVLARLLSPQEFGLVAMVMTVISLFVIFRDLGLSTATIQRADITHAQVSNLFWLNVAVSGAISLLVAISAPAVAWFYHEPKLVKITLALSGSFFLNGLTVQHIALLNRQMRFVATSAMEVGSVAAGLAVGIGAALAGYGYWSLVAATLAQAFVRLAAAWSVSSWRPQLPGRGVGTRPLVSFGANLTVSGFIYMVSRGCDSLVIGRVFGADALGLYTRAAGLLSRPMEQLISPILTVIVPALSRLQHEPERYRRFFLQVFEALAIAGFLFTGLFLPLARPLTVTILGVKWESASDIFAALSITAIFVPLSAAASWLYTSQGRGRDMLKASSFCAVVTVLSVFVGLPFGPTGVAIATSASSVLVQLPFTFLIAGRRGPVTTPHLWISFCRHLPVLFGVCGTTWLAYEMAPHLSPIKQLLLCGSGGLLVGAAVILLSAPSRQACQRLIGAFRSATITGC